MLRARQNMDRFLVHSKVRNNTKTIHCGQFARIFDIFLKFLIVLDLCKHLYFVEIIRQTNKQKRLSSYARRTAGGLEAKQRAVANGNNATVRISAVQWIFCTRTSVISKQSPLRTLCARAHTQCDVQGTIAVCRESPSQHKRKRRRPRFGDNHDTVASHRHQAVGKSCNLANRHFKAVQETVKRRIARPLCFQGIRELLLANRLAIPTLTITVDVRGACQHKTHPQGRHPDPTQVETHQNGFV